MSFTFIMQLLVSGITIGSVYGLVALGFVTIYRTSGVVNFAQGEFVMLGGMLSYWLMQRLGLAVPLAGLVTVVVVACVGLIMYQFIVFPLRNRSQFIILVTTIAVGQFLAAVALLLWGSEPVFNRAFGGGRPVQIGGVSFASQSIWVLATTAVVLIGVYVLNNHTHVGKAMTATATDRLAAGMVGIRTGSMIRWAFIMGGGMAALAGFVISPVIPMTFTVGATLTLKGFVGAVLGGWGKATGAFVGGLVLGVIETLGAGVFSSGYRDVIAFAILLLVLFMRPEGILGASLTEAK